MSSLLFASFVSSSISGGGGGGSEALVASDTEGGSSGGRGVALGSGVIGMSPCTPPSEDEDELLSEDGLRTMPLCGMTFSFSLGEIQHT